MQWLYLTRFNLRVPVDNTVTDEVWVTQTNDSLSSNENVRVFPCYVTVRNILPLVDDEIGLMLADIYKTVIYAPARGNKCPCVTGLYIPGIIPLTRPPASCLTVSFLGGALCADKLIN